MPVQTLAVPGITPRHSCTRAMSWDSAPLKLPKLLAHTSDCGDLEHSRITMPQATHSLWPYPCPLWSLWVGAFPTPGAFTYTRITWALSPTVPQVPGVTPGSPLCPWYFGHSSKRGARHSPHQTESMPSSTILEVGIPILKLPSSMVRHCVYLRVQPPQCIFKFGIVPKMLFLGGLLATLDFSTWGLHGHWPNVRP